MGLSSAEVSEETPYEPQVVQTVYDNQSHQYWNVNPMGMGNITEIPLNGSGDLLFSLDLTGFFHETVLWERGYVNYSVYQENKTLFSVEINQSIENYSRIWENMSGNITIEIQSTGSMTLRQQGLLCSEFVLNSKDRFYTCGSDSQGMDLEGYCTCGRKSTGKFFF